MTCPSCLSASTVSIALIDVLDHRLDAFENVAAHDSVCTNMIPKPYNSPIPLTTYIKYHHHYNYYYSKLLLHNNQPYTRQCEHRYFRNSIDWVRFEAEGLAVYEHVLSHVDECVCLCPRLLSQFPTNLSTQYYLYCASVCVPTSLHLCQLLCELVPRGSGRPIFFSAIPLSICVRTEQHCDNTQFLTNAVGCSTSTELIPRPARACPDPPLYLRLRMGRPIGKTMPLPTSVMSYGKNKLRPEFWFSVPKNRTDELYRFINTWVPHLYGELDEEQIAGRGFELIQHDTEWVKGAITKVSLIRGKDPIELNLIYVFFCFDRMAVRSAKVRTLPS